MNKPLRLAAVAVAAMLAAGAASAAATVTYVNTKKMTDVPRHQRDRESMEAALQEHFNTLAARLPAGQELKVDIIDIDLAGDVFPRVPIQDVRVMKGSIDYPLIHLRYSVEENGKVIRSGERELKDMSYLDGLNHYRNELFGHEKQLLDDWFRKDIVAAR